MEINLRQWQREAYEVFERNNHKGILKVGTGKGKTVFGIYCIKKLREKKPNSRICIIVPTINLMFQWRSQLIKILDWKQEDISLFYGLKKETSGQVVIFVVNSAVSDDNLRNINDSKVFDFMIADECHHYGSNLFSKIFEIKTNWSLGLSATPEREGDKEGTCKIVGGLGEKIFELNHLDDPSAIPHFVIWSVLINLDDEESANYENNSVQITKLNNYFLTKFSLTPDDHNFREEISELAKKNEPAALKLLSLWSKQAGIKYEAKNKFQAVKEIVELEKGGKIIIFNERIKFAKKLYNYLDSKNMFLIYSGLPKNEILRILDDFKQCKAGILITPRLIDEGYDVPDASVAIVASFTSSSRQMIQRDGRILRKTDDKKTATRYSLVVKDHEEYKYFNALRQSQISSAALEGMWVSFENNAFNESNEFKEEFLSFGEIDEHNENQFKVWVIKRMNFYDQNSVNNDIEKIEQKVDFFSRFTNVIESLIKEYPDRWKNLNKKMKRVSVMERTTIKTNLNNSELIKNQLRKLNARIQLPNDVFNVILRVVDSEPVEMNKSAKDYILNLTDGSRPEVWPSELYHFLKKISKNFH